MNKITEHYLGARVMINPKENTTSLYPYYIYDYEVKDNTVILHGKDVPFGEYLHFSEIMPYVLEGYTVIDEVGNILHSHEYIDDWDFYGDGEDIVVFYHSDVRIYRDYYKNKYAKGDYKEWERFL